MRISLCMIVKNEQEKLGKCLDSVKNIAEEIIIVDTGSSDDTKLIARRYTDKIYDYEWGDDFSAARNFAFSKAAEDYIMWLDADDIIWEKDMEKIRELKENFHPAVDAVLMKYVIGIDEYNNITHAFYRERILKKSKNHRWVGRVHEYLQIEGNILQTDICIFHTGNNNKSDRNLKIYEKYMHKDKEISPRDLYYYATELQNSGQHERAYKYYLKFLNSENPTPMYVADVCRNVAVYYISQNKPNEALKILIHSMEYGVMKPEILCYIGNLYKEMGEYRKAISWYELIFNLLIPKFDAELHSYDLGGFIPCIELCHCYYRIGEYTEAVRFNEMAARYKPDDPIIKYNREIFRKEGII